MGGGRNEGERRERRLPSVPTVPNVPLHHCRGVRVLIRKTLGYYLACHLWYNLSLVLLRENFLHPKKQFWVTNILLLGLRTKVQYRYEMSDCLLQFCRYSGNVRYRSCNIWSKLTYWPSSSITRICLTVSDRSTAQEMQNITTTVWERKQTK